MKILMLTPYLPYPLLSGGQIRTYNLLKKMADKHQITLFALIKNEKEKQYVNQIEPYCQQVRVFKRSQRPFTLSNILKTGFSSYPFLVVRNHVPQVKQAVKQELRQGDYDLIHAETFYMMPHLPPVNIPTILVEQTIEYLGYESYAQKAWPLLRPLLKIDINKIKRWEKYYWQQAEQLIVMSQEDQHFIQNLISDKQKVKVVSNGVDSAWFDQVERQLPPRPTMLYVGTFKWLPNIEAVQFLVKKVWPLLTKLIPEAQLKIVGNAPTAEIKQFGRSHDNITVAGRIPDIRTAFKSSHLLLAPVFSGKGTRYKILEAMACGTPIVATDTAVEGLNVTDQKQVLIANQAQDMAQAAVHLIENQELWQQLSEQGHRFVQKKYDWSLIAQQLDYIYQSLG
jgi:glycosyltransferase involved in cell wall biosynthesis